VRSLDVTAVHHGGFTATVHARGHEIAVDEPVESGGHDDGAMPTELLLGSLASCFALALDFAARKRDQELPGLRVRVVAERAGTELRYARIVVTATADVPAAELAPLVERARRFCWVSNTFATPPDIAYRSETEVPRASVSSSSVAAAPEPPPRPSPGGWRRT
jgi:putative redox protein